MTSDLRGKEIIDSRDVIARIRELEVLEAEAIAALGKGENWTAENGTEYGETSDWTEEEHDELLALRNLESEASGSPDWSYGEALIADSYFEEYAQELAEDIGAVHKNATWPNNFIDWEAAADALKQDYIRVDFDGTDYWIRA